MFGTSATNDLYIKKKSHKGFDSIATLILCGTVCSHKHLVLHVPSIWMVCHPFLHGCKLILHCKSGEKIVSEAVIFCHIKLTP